MTNKQKTIIECTPMASDPRPLSTRERKFLKALGRRMGLRVTSIRDAKPATAAPASEVSR